MKHKIMIVDESAGVLESMKWVFADEPYYLFAFDSPLDGLQVIGATEFAVVVAEHSMKKMDGIDFLKRVKNKSPHTMGIIMTSYKTFRDALDTINPGCVFGYAQKPLDYHAMRRTVKEAIACYEINTEKCGFSYAN